MDRRTFIQAMAGGCMLGGAAASAKTRRFRVAKRGTIKKVVVLFQRGGNDGLNTLIPVETTQYNLLTELRPTVRIPSSSILSIPNDSFFGLHPSLAPLVPIISAGDLSMIHAVGYPDPDRSHFESQSFYETAVPGVALMDGWLNRYLSGTAGPGLIRGISIGSNIPQAATGIVPVPVSNNFGISSIELDPFLNSTEETAYTDEMRALLALTPSAGNESIYNTGNRVFDMIDSFATRDLRDYAPENGATYPDSRLGDRVSHAAQMLKDEDSFLGIEVVTIDQGGHDTHAGQLDPSNPTTGGHANLLGDLADCMSAFYTDMGPARMEDTVFMVVTEFGRRAYQNDSFGTDHGTGCVVMAMGGAVNGSMVNGGASWPSLADLYRGDDLRWVTDFRDIYWEVLSRHVGVDNTTLASIIPGHTYNPVGFIT